MTTTPPNGNATPRPILALVALASGRFPTASELVAQLRTLDPGAEIGAAPREGAGQLSITYAGSVGAVNLAASPIPWNQVEGPCATAWWWPQAAEAMRRPTEHLIVALVGTGESVLARMLAATHFIAAAVKATDAVGVYWGAGGIVHEAREFVRQAAEGSLERPPIHLWIDMRIERNDDGSYRFFTTGLAQFGRLEMEVESSRRAPQEILDFMYDLVFYVVTRDVEISDGETVGRTESDRVAVSIQPSVVTPDQNVVRVAF